MKVRDSSGRRRWIRFVSHRVNEAQAQIGGFQDALAYGYRVTPGVLRDHDSVCIGRVAVFGRTDKLIDARRLFLRAIAVFIRVDSVSQRSFGDLDVAVR
jgi:hypothetical protein